MVKQSKAQRTSRKPWLIVGSLLLLVLVGADGCGTNPAQTAQTNQAQTNQGQTNQGRPGQGQRSSNPAEQAAMEIRRLQSNQENALTSDQKAKIKPILQALIDTTNPSQDVLQQKADAINAVLTTAQKSYLSTATQRPTAGTNQNPNNANGANGSTRPNSANGSNGNRAKGTPPQGGTGSQQGKGTFNPAAIYQQVLDLLK